MNSFTQIFGQTTQGTNDLCYIKARDDAANYHVKITGKSGTGKTTAALSLVLQAVYAGRTAIVINSHNSLLRQNMHSSILNQYEKIVNVLKINPGNPILLPLFDNKNSNLSLCLLTSILSRAGNLTDAQESRLEQAIEDVISAIDENLSFSKRGIKSVGDFLRAQDTATAYNAFSKLRSIFSFNLVRDGNSFFKDGVLYEVDVNSLNSNDQDLFCRFLIEFLLNNLNKLANGMTFFIDEAQNYDYAKGSALYRLLNEARKMNVQLILAGTAFGKNSSVTSQCNYHIAFAENDITEIKKIIFPYERRAQTQLFLTLQNLKRGQAVFIGDFDTLCNQIATHMNSRFTVGYTFFPSCQEEKFSVNGTL